MVNKNIFLNFSFYFSYISEFSLVNLFLLQVKEKKTPKISPFIDLSPLHSRSAKVLLLAAGLAAFGLYTPVFFLVSNLKGKFISRLYLGILSHLIIIGLARISRGFGRECFSIASDFFGIRSSARLCWLWARTCPTVCTMSRF